LATGCITWRHERGPIGSMGQALPQVTDCQQQCQEEQCCKTTDDEASIFETSKNSLFSPDLVTPLPTLDDRKDDSRGHAETTEEEASTSYFLREEIELEHLNINGFYLQNGAPYTFETGAVYTGQWRCNKRHGYGCQEWPDGATYEGEWHENRAAGKGRLRHCDGDVFVGQWRNNKAWGVGVFYHQGCTYRGQWRNDMQDGYGVETWVEGVSYQGLFSDGYKAGFGCYRWVDGSTYHGRHIDNVIDGEGIYLASDGRRFEGQWKESVIHGMGRYEWPNGRAYRGCFAYDRKHGFGIFQWPDGRKYEGFWCSGRQHGLGRYTSRDGTVEDVEFPDAEVGMQLLRRGCSQDLQPQDPRQLPPVVNLRAFADIAEDTEAHNKPPGSDPRQIKQLELGQRRSRLDTVSAPPLVDLRAFGTGSWKNHQDDGATPDAQLRKSGIALV